MWETTETEPTDRTILGITNGLTETYTFNSIEKTVNTSVFEVPDVCIVGVTCSW